MAIPEIPNPEEIENRHTEHRKSVAKTNRENKAAAIRNERTPMPAETPVIKPVETPPQEMDQKAAETKADGVQIPISNVRPQAPMASKEQGSVIVAKALAEQLGTDPEMKSNMQIDERKMGVLSDGTLAALSHFSYRNVYDGVRYWGHITEWWLKGSQGIGGLGRRHILQALANTSGIEVMDKANKPNALARNLWDRDWKRKAESEGKDVEE